MLIKLGIYDFFSIMIPGAITIVAFLFVLVRRFGLLVDYTSLSIVELSAFGVFAYLIGYPVDYICGKTWQKLFRPKNLFEKTTEDFKKKHPYLEIHEMNWYIALTYIRRHNEEMAADIIRFNAQNIMLKNSSFGLLLFSIVFLIEFLIASLNPLFITLSVISLIVSIILAKQSVILKTWFYQSIYESLAALVAQPRNLPVKFKSKSRSPQKTKLFT